jgi:hypothetical protein
MNHNRFFRLKISFSGKVPARVVFVGNRKPANMDDELKAAKAAKAAVNDLMRATAKSGPLAAIRAARQAAILNLSSEGSLNDARGRVGIALGNVMDGLPTQEKIDKAKSAIDVWIWELEAA